MKVPGLVPLGSCNGEAHQNEQIVQDNNVEELRSARELWCENGGADLDESLLPKSPEADAPDGTKTVPSHTRLQARTGRAVRLCSKAFMLTFNSMVFVQSPELWASFQQWVEERSRAEKAQYWSATVEESAHCRHAFGLHTCRHAWSWQLRVQDTPARGHKPNKSSNACTFYIGKNNISAWQSRFEEPPRIAFLSG